jgi:hypothetical protein
MPSTSKKQHNFMAAIAKNPAFAKKVGIKASVGEEFLTADKGKKFRSGGMAKAEMKESKSESKKEMAMDKKQDVAMIKKAFKEHDAQEHKGGKGTKLKLKKGGMAMKKAKRYDEGGDVETETKQGKNSMIDDETRRKAMEMVNLDVDKEPRLDDVPMPKSKSKAKPKAKSNVMTRAMSKMNPAGDTYKKGGSVRGCGIATKGLTKGKIV